MKKYLVTLAALGLCTSVLAQSVTAGGGAATIVGRDGSTVSAGPGGASISSSRNGNTVSSGGAGSVILDNQSSVTSSVTTDSTGTTSSTISNSRTGSMCSAVNEGMRCEISCQAPQLAQCSKGGYAGEPVCFCR